MKKQIIQFIAIIISSLAVGGILYSFIHSSEPNNQNENISSVIGITKDRIIINLLKDKIFLYENNEVKKSEQIPENKKFTLDFPSGEYSLSDIKNLNTGSNIIDSTIGNEEIFVINDVSKESGGDDSETQKYYFMKDEGYLPKVSAKAILIADLKNNSVVYSKNENEKYPIASVSKVMTALVATKEMEKNKYITITKDMMAAGYGNYGHLSRGEKITAGELVFPLLLTSSNEAAYALSMNYGQENFVEKMNDKAQALGMKDTYYEEASGLSPNNVSTTNDLFTLTKHIYNNERWLFDITKMEKVNNWNNSNFLAGQKNYLGGKNGHIPEALQTAISLFSIPFPDGNERDLAIVILQSEDRKTDTYNVLKWLDKNILYREDIQAKKLFSQEETENFTKEMKTFSILFTGNISTENYTGEEFKKLNADKNVDIVMGNLDAPISDIGEKKKDKKTVRMHPLMAGKIKRAGFDILSVANDNIDDWGEKAFLDTLSRLEDENISFVGGGKNNSEAISPVIFEKDGVKIGFLAFNAIDIEDDLKTLTKSRTLNVDDKFEERIKYAKSKSDILVVSLHFGSTPLDKALDKTLTTSGDENSSEPDETQEKLAKMAIDNGANIVIGAHPKYVQKVEEYNGGVIAYSLGDFVSDNFFQGVPLEIKISGMGKIREIKKIEL